MNGALVFTVVIISDILLLKICRILWKEWSHPIFLIDIVFMLLIIVAYCGLKKYQWNFGGVAWITAALYFLTIGGAFGKQLFRKRNSYFATKDTVYKNVSNRAWMFLLLMIVLGMVGWLYQVTYNGFSLKDFASIDSLAQMNNSIAVERYSGQSKTNAIIKILNMFLYIGPVCGGFLFPFAETKFKKRVAALSMLPIILVMLFCNGKAGFLASLVLWVSAFLMAYFYLYKTAPKFNIKKVVFYVAVFSVVIGALLFTMMLRIGRVDAVTFEIVKDKFMIYAFGEIQAFDCWFSAGRSSIEHSAGVQTFMAIFNTLGIVERAQGVYGLMPNALGNVYTLFRGIIEDFGVMGGLVFVAVCGCFAGYCFERVRYSVTLPTVPVTIVVGIVFFFVYGYIISPWVYSSFVLTLFVFMYFTTLCRKSNIRIRVTCGNRRLIG